MGIFLESSLLLFIFLLRSLKPRHALLVSFDPLNHPQSCGPCWA